MDPAAIAYVEQFNSDLKVLTRDLADRHKEDAKIWRAKERVMTIISIDPLYTITTVGPYLYSYRAQIYDESGTSEDFFLRNKYDAELEAADDRAQADLVSYIIPRMKKTAETLSPDDRAQYMELVRSLLDSYIEYLGCQFNRAK